MSSRWFALCFVWIAVVLGWFWRIADEQDLAVAPLGYGGFISLALWLWARLERTGRQRRPDWGPNLVDCPISTCDGAAMSQAALNEHLRVRHGDS